MSIFSRISEAIFGRPAQPRGPTQPKAAAPSASGIGGAFDAVATETRWWASQAAQGQDLAVSETDVIATLEARAASHGEKLNWRTSIVDLMKLLGIDSSLENRKELARELGYTGDTADSAAMNVWLHRQVMRELAANGGQVPADLTD